MVFRQMAVIGLATTDIQIETFQPMYDAQSVIASAPTGQENLGHLPPVLSRMVAEREAAPRSIQWGLN